MGNWIGIVVFDIDGVVRDVSGSYRRALADTVEYFTGGLYRPTQLEIDRLKSEGFWNNDWEASQELVYRFFEGQGRGREQVGLDYQSLVEFFNTRYRGSDPHQWTGYICDEALLLDASYLEGLTSAGILWGFFSGAGRDEANYALLRRLNLQTPVLIAMEDAPGKPDPTGLFAAVEQLEQRYQVETDLPIIYVGDTVADMLTVEKARSLHPERVYLGVGILPPHVQETVERRQSYEQSLQAAGAVKVFSNIQELTAEEIQQLL